QSNVGQASCLSQSNVGQASCLSQSNVGQASCLSQSNVGQAGRLSDSNADKRDAYPTLADKRDAYPTLADKRDAYPTLADKRDAYPTSSDERDTYASFFNPRKELQISARHLPHWRQESVSYFITFRLADAIPQEKLRRWMAEREQWLATHPEPRSPESIAEYYNRFPRRMEQWLDAGAGSCRLRDPENAKIVADALRYFDNERYHLGEWVVMPNHVHVVVTPLQDYLLPDILHSWKSYTAKQINRRTGQTGQLWQHESYDHIIRNPRALAAINRYIQENPTKAKTKVGQASCLSQSNVGQASCLSQSNDSSTHPPSTENPGEERVQDSSGGKRDARPTLADKRDACPTLTLTTEIAARRADQGLLSNFISAIERDEHHENWRSLYRLPPRIIQQLRSTPLGPEHRDLLVALPKAELHCHIGGILDIPAQRSVAEAIWESLALSEQEEAVAKVRALNWEAEKPHWSQALRQGNRPANIAATFHERSDAEIRNRLFPPNLCRIGLKHSHPAGFNAYEWPGELSGSAVLSHPAALAPTVTGILDHCQANGIRYLELRGSPQKYRPRDPVQWLQDFSEEWKCQRASEGPILRFIWIADRRSDKQAIPLPQILKEAIRARQLLDDFLVGIDLAGNEAIGRPEELAPAFLPAFRDCLPITIHAGEGEKAENIWEAAYHLHADRIGHGLTLAEHPSLLKRFRDRDICLELCPTSNREVVGFYDPKYPESTDYPHYPLQTLWKHGIPLTLCTDNPGISQCTLADEYLTAARMCQDKPLSLWDALAMIKQGFLHAFLPSATREHLIKETDSQT
ncbi:MAG: transposase, partial [Puniceicoccales bacterium]